MEDHTHKVALDRGLNAVWKESTADKRNSRCKGLSMAGTDVQGKALSLVRLEQRAQGRERQG